MLSVANVRSAGGAASYFAADNYYAKADAERSGEWVGKGAEALGLKGRVDPQMFEAILRGELPGGTQIGNAGRVHRPGTDLTFSMPKSWSLLALVGGDKRLMAAYGEAVKETLGWAERNLAETRMEMKGKEQVVSTGNLVIALFQHDTNRNEEPNAHFHGVIANMTQGPDGKWRALRNDRLWSLNTLLNSMTMSAFRERVEELGYDIGASSKHGNFEAKGIARNIIMAFSTRRQEVLDARRGPGLEAGIIAALDTRRAKENVVDREVLYAGWQAEAKVQGVDFASVVRDAQTRARSPLGRWDRLVGEAKSISERGQIWLRIFAEKLGSPKHDPLVPARTYLLDRKQIAAAQATAAAIRHLSEREAAFEGTDLLKAALDFGLPTTTAHVENQISRLTAKGVLERGKGVDATKLTTATALGVEARILDEVAKGRGQSRPILAPETAPARLQAQAEISNGFVLNIGQEAAGTMLLTSAHRIVAVQGVAGAGKSSMLKPVAALMRAEGRTVLGLAIQNTLVQMLARDIDVEAMTLSRFLRVNASLLHKNPDPVKLAEARTTYKCAVLLLDEASMVGNNDKDKLVRLANILEVERLALVGDKRQLAAVDAGKPFALVQAAGIPVETMNANVRARDRMLRSAQIAAQGGNVTSALLALRDATIEAPGEGGLKAAEIWLALPPAERNITAIYASGRRLRDEINQAVQTGLAQNGELGKPHLALETLSRVNVTSEELRHATTYQPGQILEVKRLNRRTGLARGEWRVDAVDAKSGSVTVINSRGRVSIFRPDRLSPASVEGALRLSEPKQLTLYVSDRIRWTENDAKRGLFNADQARVVAINKQGVTVETSNSTVVKLAKHDPMLRHLDLAYALNAHMAQGLTSDRGIAVMDSRERNLSNKQTFLVTITRLRDHLTLIVDNADRIERAILGNDGSKSSALEVTGRLKSAAAEGLAKGLGSKNAERTAEVPQFKEPEIDRTRQRGISL